jgi:hypothetical protein
MRSLRDESVAAADRIADANRAFEPVPREQALAWVRLQRAMQSRWTADRARAERRLARRAGLRFLAGAGALASLALSVWLVIRPHPNAVGPTAPVAAAAPHTAPAIVSLPSPAPRAPSSARASSERAPDELPPPHPVPPVALSPGRSWLAAGVRARLAPRGAAVVRLGSAASRVVSLLRGRIDIDMGAVSASADIAPSGGGATASPELAPASPPPARVEVQVASYRLEPDSGRFSVSARGEKVDVVVHSGKLAVWSSRRLLATVVAGQRWTNLSARAAGRGGAIVSAGDGAAGVEVAAAVAAPAAVEAPSLEPGADNRAAAAVEGPDCARLTRGGDIDGALACLARASERPGLVGELALMELARIRRDVKGDLAGAERALAEHRRRFPGGALSDEATGARVELLVRLARPAEALAEAAHLGGGDAIFWRAVCLAKLGRGAEAARAFDEYLARPDGKRHAEAERMRRELTP